MGATGTKIDRAASVTSQTLHVLRQLLVELGGQRGLAELTARGTAAHLERELGLVSRERVELILRLGDACGVRLPARVVAEADTVEDLVEAVLREETVTGSAAAGATAAGAAISATPIGPAAIHADIEEQIRNAETLTEIFRLRGRGEPARAHIYLFEENDEPRTITFG